MTCYYPLKGWQDPATKGWQAKKGGAHTKMEVACGQCRGCRIDHSRMWAMRCVHEAQMHEENSFITLTYEKEPAGGTLVKSHFQDFMKRLRQKIRPKKVRYYQCGEYGDELARPHYHAILFGLDFDDKEALREKNGSILYTSKMLSDTWGRGFVTIGDVTFESCAYVSRYILKKINGKAALDHYMRADEYGVAYWIEPEYTTMSRKPGIGKDWYEKYKDDIWPSDEVPVPGSGVFKKVPRYYEEILKHEDPLTLEEMKKIRVEWMKKHGEEYSEQRLRAKEKVLEAKINMLEREI